MDTEQQFYSLTSLQKGTALQEFHSRAECHRNSWDSGFLSEAPTKLTLRDSNLVAICLEFSESHLCACSKPKEHQKGI